jgi:hypothetical protein
MTQEEINQKAEEFEYTNGVYAFKEAIKWYQKQIKQNHDKERETIVSQNSSVD